ncbi:MAG: type II secretion system protein [Phycisphaerales bacterium]
MRRADRRAFTLIELLVCCAIIAVAMSFLLSSRPTRVALRLQLVSGHQQIEQLTVANASKEEMWSFKIPHCERLVRFCKGEPLFKESQNPDGTREDKNVLKLEATMAEYVAAVERGGVPSPGMRPLSEIESDIEALRSVIELAYLGLTPEET